MLWDKCTYQQHISHHDDDNKHSFVFMILHRNFHYAASWIYPLVTHPQILIDKFFSPNIFFQLMLLQLLLALCQHVFLISVMMWHVTNINFNFIWPTDVNINVILISYILETPGNDTNFITTCFIVVQLRVVVVNKEM